ncbi:hypothetical protein DTO164E3_8761 [Paecilomyces variotii]|nr:hypothetical protein DTO164E3_8761 [Paecilomyces variotii]KAJ9209023.1 hypothetical protein DTO032I3_240 [Paecilomyces variotii]KAJ9282903.1 hypothetical protein DTO021D3_240 [Paecilomyces variotii]KAJ9386911.1 hypothetical protein DTO032I4_3355 [Paecilomyces variotii]
MAVVGIAERGDSDAVGINLQHNRTRLLVTLRSSPQSRLSDAAELDVDSADVQEVAKRKVSLSGSANLIKIIIINMDRLRIFSAGRRPAQHPTLDKAWRIIIIRDISKSSVVGSSPEAGNEIGSLHRSSSTENGGSWRPSIAGRSSNKTLPLFQDIEPPLALPVPG